MCDCCSSLFPNQFSTIGRVPPPIVEGSAPRLLEISLPYFRVRIGFKRANERMSELLRNVERLQSVARYSERSVRNSVMRKGDRMCALA
jgi:hypothetical protein